MQDLQPYSLTNSKIKTMKEFTCAKCGESFESDWPEAEAEKEMKKNFGDVPEEERAIVCDDCYNEFMEWYENNQVNP